VNVRLDTTVWQRDAHPRSTGLIREIIRAALPCDLASSRTAFPKSLRATVPGFMISLPLE